MNRLRPRGGLLGVAWQPVVGALVYGVAFWALYPLVGVAAAALGLFPVVIAARVSGTVCGVFTCACVFALDYCVLFRVEGLNGADVLLNGGFVYWSVCLVVATFVGHLRALNGRVMQELAQRQRAEADLTLAHRELEQRVEERTGQLAASELRSRLLLENISDVITVTDGLGIIRYESPSITAVLGWAPEELEGRSFAELVHPDDRGAVAASFGSFVNEGVQAPMRFRFATRDGGWVMLESSGKDLREVPAIGGIVATSRDLTVQLAAEERIRRLAYNDELTGLPNRRHFAQHLEQALSGSRRHSTSGAVLFLDLDGFKHINDTLGHSVGDLLLQAAAAALTRQVRPDDTVARMGGDEFTILLPHIASVQEAVALAQRILATFAGPICIDGHEFYVGASIGISLFPADGSTSDAVLKNADAAMYRAKAAGRHTFALYSESMNLSAADRLFLDGSLRRALEHNEFLLHYQPQVDLCTGQIMGVEALLRWQHPQRGFISPSTFIPIAEDNGTILAIGTWALREACRQARAWQDMGLDFPVAVNLSPRQLANRQLLEVVQSALRDHDLRPHRIDLEMTEGALAQSQDAVNIVGALKSQGMRLSLDDFGTGYSSLSRLRQFPLDVLKLDRAFVQGMTHSNEGEAVVRAVIELGHALHMTVIAEGVEAADERDRLARLGCDGMQGYFYSPPVTPDRIESMLLGIAV